MNGPKAELKPGNWLKLKDIPVGIEICCIEMQPGAGAKLVRSAGQVATLRGKEESYAQIKLPSGEVRMIHVNCRAMIGQIGNIDKMNAKLGKARSMDLLDPIAMRMLPCLEYVYGEELEKTTKNNL